MDIVSILEFIGALAVLIFIHELGHFLAAKIFHVGVEEFGFGIPPRAVTLFKVGETIVSLNWLPLGGFVRLKGETDPSIPGGLAAANPWKRICVYMAGPAMNLLAAVILYAIIFARIEAPDLTRLNDVMVMTIAQNSPAETNGLQLNDVIQKVNDQTINNIDTLQAIVAQNLGKEITLTVLRGGETVQIKLTPRANPPANEGAIGIGLSSPSVKVNFFTALPAGVYATYEQCVGLLTMVGKLISGRVPASQGRLVGYKGMYDIFQNIRTSGDINGYPAWIGVLGFFTSITISLGLLNLLPIPALDGGRVVISALPEIILRRRLSPEFENVAIGISLLLLIVLLVVVNLQDIINPIKIPPTP